MALDGNPSPTEQVWRRAFMHLLSLNIEAAKRRAEEHRERNAELSRRADEVRRMLRRAY